ncbi:TIGR03086 family metal-binding protein [Streptomyces sp. NPDC017993]|uniref:TIGR03086 family metal-binding protein n=1 Tax=Streptomyces sp. NPDC017993 TaxID=3365027 RepID=UPI0037B3CE27
MPTNEIRSGSAASRDAASPPPGEELLVLDADAVRISLEVVARVTPADLDRATPCAGWTLRDLLVHMTAQHYGFAAAARGESGLEPWRPRAGEHDPVSAYRCAAERVLAAFAEAGVLDGYFRLPEIDAERPFRAARAIGFHLVDYVVHSWDVARSVGGTVDFGPRLLDAALAVARAVPDGPARTVPGAAFAPRTPYPHRTPLEEILALLGRSPAWPE